MKANALKKKIADGVNCVGGWVRTTLSGGILRRSIFALCWVNEVPRT